LWNGFWSFRPVERPEKSENWIFLDQIERNDVHFLPMRLKFFCFLLRQLDFRHGEATYFSFLMEF